MGSGIRNLWLMLAGGKLNLAVVGENLFLRLPTTKKRVDIISSSWRRGGVLSARFKNRCVPLENGDFLCKMKINEQFVPELIYLLF